MLSCPKTSLQGVFPNIFRWSTSPDLWSICPDYTLFLYKCKELLEILMGLLIIYPHFYLLILQYPITCIASGSLIEQDL